MSETNPSPALRKAMQRAASEAMKRALFGETAMAGTFLSKLRTFGREAR